MGAQFVGNNDATINQALKVWIKKTGGTVSVCGLIGPGTSRQITAKYSEPFAQSSLGAMPGLEKIAALGQLTTGKTSVTALNTAQVWEGNEPYVFTVGMSFYATQDAYSEVTLPINYLEQWIAADVNSSFPLNITDVGNVMGRVPPFVTLNIGRTLLMPGCIIESITTPLDKERDKSGNLIRADVQLQIKTQRMQTLSDVLVRQR